MKLGVFGGTFDPPHIGHLIAAQDAKSALALDRVIFVPAAVPPHKRDDTVSAAGTRLAMVRAAIAGADGFEVDDLELRRGGPSWTVDTLRELAARLPGSELFLLIGSDQHAEFESWREPDKIGQLAKVAVLTRENGVRQAAGVHTVRVTRIDVSSTDIRRRTAEGQPIRFLVPAAVEALIRLHGLYGAIPGDRDRIGIVPGG
ncbi:MAG TPA: nicotinate-nucleotide adenylyltransferase [Longimicrobiales bacterium]|nr:nicotinate-nucleotide adenylyltransferase [Longimicrobiales bacterium]